ncbi:MAG: hypothetical protein KGL39_48695 [Patescibacteria group bacterium]|nr:hypothetical protein [Patescibacteria group bacterium]
MLTATLLGYVLLIPFCLAQAWKPSQYASIGQKMWITRGPVDRWSWKPLNYVYGNPEDGVSGQTALIWGSGADAGKLVPYMPGANAAWRAYCWSAGRNSAGALKYAFQWRGKLPAPFKSGVFSVFGVSFTYGFGWKLENGSFYVPVASVRPPPRR